MNNKFCKECNNMLYPKEDRGERILYLACRNCEHFEESTNPLVYQSILSHNNQQSTLSSLSQDLAKDPTLPRSMEVECPECNNNEAAYFQTRDREEDVALTIYYVCCKCYHTWSGV
ncbi:DNA-directed RNA polymerase II subunit RPB9 [Astathelohania contejeani]|uniref:DNA-directed RNA polymerase subunit n=1 Tax=Astathelohania contejeani TaxID=164912 RepID=A0ABQ7HXH1_9MICR|nr:DNA-directed RNA polymerase II subunit RPB9 [Thelohania contejeani]